MTFPRYEPYDDLAEWTSGLTGAAGDVAVLVRVLEQTARLLRDLAARVDALEGGRVAAMDRAALLDDRLRRLEASTSARLRSLEAANADRL